MSFYKQRATVFTMLLICLLISSHSEAVKAGTQWQRDSYKEALKALKKGRLEKFQQLSSSLTDYSLYPYLQYRFINSRLSRVNPVDIKHFFKNHSAINSMAL